MNTDDYGKEIPGSVFSMKGKCPECGNENDFELRDYSEVMHDGDIHCAKCGAFIRVFDAG